MCLLDQFLIVNIIQEPTNDPKIEFRLFGIAECRERERSERESEKQSNGTYSDRIKEIKRTLFNDLN